MEMDYIKENLADIHSRIANACKAAGRKVEGVKLLLATKTVEPGKVQYAVEQGELLLGENKVQEGLQKQEILKALPAAWHFIGHLQTNKIKDVLKWATCIQSIDSIELAQKLNDRLVFEKKTVEVMVQVNTSYEESKFGVEPADALALVKEVLKYEAMKLTGLMTIGLQSDDETQVRKGFRLLKQIQNELKEEGIEAPELSMGMSHDLELAIAEGATIVRVGSAVFGQRDYAK